MGRDIREIKGSRIALSSLEHSHNIYIEDIDDIDEIHQLAIQVDDVPEFVEELVELLQSKSRYAQLPRLHKINRWLDKRGWGVLNNENTINIHSIAQTIADEVAIIQREMDKLKTFIKDNT